MSHRRSVDEKNRLKRLSEETPHCYAGGAWYDGEKGRYIRVWISGRGGRPKYLRKRTNKKLRRCKDLLNYGKYRKVFDYWWEVL